MSKYRCAKCNTPLKDDAVENSEWFPFCTERCKMADLGAWFSGEYAIPGKRVGHDEIPDKDQQEDEDDQSRMSNG